jgi:methyl-accepting chemotaxis protein
MSDDTFRWFVAGAVAISTLCILVMGAVAVLLFGVIRKLQTRAEGIITKVEPMLDTARRLADENSPKISAIATRAREIADNAKDMSDVAREQAHRWAEVGRDIADRTQAQVAKVEAAMDETVDNVQHAGTNVKEAVMKPVREASGVLAGIRAAVSTYAHGRRPSIDNITQDEEMFI